MTKHQNRFAPDMIKENPDPKFGRFIKAFEKKYFIERKRRDALYAKFENAQRYKLYYRMLYEWLSGHPERESKVPATFEEGIEYTQKELEVFFSKHLQYEAVADYIKALL